MINHLNLGRVSQIIHTFKEKAAFSRPTHSKKNKYHNKIDKNTNILDPLKFKTGFNNCYFIFSHGANIT